MPKHLGGCRAVCIILEEVGEGQLLDRTAVCMLKSLKIFQI